MLTHDERIRLCEVCRNRSFDLQQGILCGLTKERPAFEEVCTDQILDHSRVRDRARRNDRTGSVSDPARRSKLVLLLLPILGAMLIFGAFMWSLHGQRKQELIKQEFERFADALAYGLSNGRPETIDTAIHYGMLFSKAAERFDVRTGVYDRRVLDQFRFGNALVRDIGPNGEMSLIDLHVDGRSAVALYRILGDDNMDHLEMTFTHQGGIAYVSDVFRSSSGSLLSEALIEPELLKREHGYRIVEHFYAMRNLGYRLSNGAVDEVWEALHQIPPPVRCSMLTRSVYLNAAAWFGGDIHEQALQVVIAVAEPDPRFVAYRRHRVSYLLGDMENCIEQLDLLEPHIHMDPWMQVIRSRALTELGDTTGAFRSVHRALEMDPLDAKLHFEYLHMLASMAPHEQALMQADTMIFVFGYPRSDPADFMDPIPGIDTSQALFNWR